MNPIEVTPGGSCCCFKQGTVTPSKRKGGRFKGAAASKRSRSQSSSKEEASPSPKKASRLQDERSPEGSRLSRPQTKESAQDSEGAHRNGGRLPKAHSHKKKEKHKEEEEEEEEENDEDTRDVCSTPAKDSEGEVAGLCPLPGSGILEFSFLIINLWMCKGQNPNSDC